MKKNSLEKKGGLSMKTSFYFNSAKHINDSGGGQIKSKPCRSTAGAKLFESSKTMRNAWRSLRQVYPVTKSIPDIIA
jgi:hypothetical protein